MSGRHPRASFHRTTRVLSTRNGEPLFIGGLKNIHPNSPKRPNSLIDTLVRKSGYQYNPYRPHDINYREKYLTHGGVFEHGRNDGAHGSKLDTRYYPRGIDGKRRYYDPITDLATTDD